LCEIGIWKKVEAGRVIVREGRKADKVFYIHRGAAEVLIGEDIVGEIKSDTRFIGRLDRDTTTIDQQKDGDFGSWHSSIITTSPSLILEWNAKELYSLIDSDPLLQKAAMASQIHDLTVKLQKMRIEKKLSDPESEANKESNKKYKQQINLLVYQAMLKQTVVDGVVDSRERDELVKFRKLHGISEEKHLEYLKEMGWDEKEFMRGKQYETVTHQLDVSSTYGSTEDITETKSNNREDIDIKPKSPSAAILRKPSSEVGIDVPAEPQPEEEEKEEVLLPEKKLNKQLNINIVLPPKNYNTKLPSLNEKQSEHITEETEGQRYSKPEEKPITKKISRQNSLKYEGTLGSLAEYLDVALV